MVNQGHSFPHHTAKVKKNPKCKLKQRQPSGSSGSLWKRMEEFIFFVEIHWMSFFGESPKKTNVYIYIYISTCTWKMPCFMDLTILGYHIQVTLTGAAQVSSPLALPLHPPHHHRWPARPGMQNQFIFPQVSGIEKKRTT